MRVDYTGQFWDVVFDVVCLGLSISDVAENSDDIWAWAGLVADVVSILIPFVSGGGLAVKVATKLDDFSDAIRISDNIVESSKVGWRLGDDITNLTKAGNSPSWSTVRQRYWKNEAFYNPSKYTESDLLLMKSGRAPIKYGAPMELHHPFGRQGNNFYIFEALTKAQHHFIHYGW